MSAFIHRDNLQVRPLDEELEELGLNPSAVLGEIDRQTAMLEGGPTPMNLSGLQEGDETPRSMGQFGATLLSEKCQKHGKKGCKDCKKDPAEDYDGDDGYEGMDESILDEELDAVLLAEKVEGRKIRGGLRRELYDIMLRIKKQSGNVTVDANEIASYSDKMDPKMVKTMMKYFIQKGMVQNVGTGISPEYRLVESDADFDGELLDEAKSIAVGDKKYQVVKKYPTKDHADGPFPKSFIRMIKKGGGAALLKSGSDHYFLAMVGGKPDGSPVWLKPAQSKRVMSYESIEDLDGEALGEAGYTARTKADESYAQGFMAGMSAAADGVDPLSSIYVDKPMKSDRNYVAGLKDGAANWEGDVPDRARKLGLTKAYKGFHGQGSWTRPENTARFRESTEGSERIREYLVVAEGEKASMAKLDSAIEELSDKAEKTDEEKAMLSAFVLTKRLNQESADTDDFENLEEDIAEFLSLFSEGRDVHEAFGIIKKARGAAARVAKRVRHRAYLKVRGAKKLAAKIYRRRFKRKIKRREGMKMRKYGKAGLKRLHKMGKRIVQKATGRKKEWDDTLSNIAEEMDLDEHLDQEPIVIEEDIEEPMSPVAEAVFNAAKAALYMGEVFDALGEANVSDALMKLSDRAVDLLDSIDEEAGPTEEQETHVHTILSAVTKAVAEHEEWGSPSLGEAISLGLISEGQGTWSDLTDSGSHSALDDAS